MLCTMPVSKLYLICRKESTVGLKIVLLDRVLLCRVPVYHFAFGTDLAAICSDIVDSVS